MALTLLPNFLDSENDMSPETTLPDAGPSPDFSGDLVSTVASTGVPMTEKEALAEELPPQELSITAGASVPVPPPEIPDPALTRNGIPQTTDSPLAKSFNTAWRGFMGPRNWEEWNDERQRQSEIRKELSTPAMKETFRMVLDETSPLMAGESRSYEDPEKENTHRIVDKFLKNYTGGEIPFGENDIQRKMLIQEAAYQFFDGRGGESEVALKGEIVNAALADKEYSAAEYRVKFAVISPKLSKLLGTGAQAQVLSGHDPGVVKKITDGLNELGNEDVSGRVSQALHMGNGDLDEAIRQQKENAAMHRELLKPKGFLNNLLSGFAGSNPYGDSSASSMQLAAEAEKTAGILEGIQAEFDRMGVAPEDRANYILDTVKATAWTKNTDDKIRLGSDFRIHINPGKVFGDRAGLVAEIQASAASPDEKHDAIKRLDLMRSTMAEKMDEILRRTDATQGDEWKKKATMVSPAARLVYGSPNTDSYIGFVRDGHFTNKVDALDAYTKSQSDRNFLFGYDDAITVGIQTGLLGIAKTAVGTTAGLSGVAGNMGSETAKEWSGALGEKQMAIGDMISDMNTASDLRGNTGGRAVAKDLSNGFTQVGPMVAGGHYSAGLRGLSSVVVGGLVVYGTSAAQGYESMTHSALEHARQQKRGDLTREEVAAVLADPKTQTGAFLNAIQTVVLTKLMPGGTERAALGRMENMTIRDVLSRGGEGLFKNPTFRKEMWQLTKNIFADASDEMIEEFFNTATEHLIRAGTLEQDLKFGDLLMDSAYSSLLAGPVGGMTPQAFHGQKFHERIRGVPTTIFGPDPETEIAEPGSNDGSGLPVIPLNPIDPEGAIPEKSDRQGIVRKFRADLISGKHDPEDLGRRAKGDPELEGFLKNHADQLRQAEDAAFEKARESGSVNTDEVRPFLPGYGEADPFTRDNDYHQAASQMNDRVLARMLAGPARTGVITVLAGGGGSGKSTASAAFVPESDFTFDTTLSSPYWAEKLQQQIEESGRKMDVVYIHRRFPLAVDNMVNRYLDAESKGEVGRIVPLAIALSAHIGAQETILGLAEKGVPVTIVDNNGAFGTSHEITLEDLAENRYIPTHEQEAGNTGRTGSSEETTHRGADSQPERGSDPRRSENREIQRRAAEKTLGEEGRRVIEGFRAEGVLTDAAADAFLGKPRQDTSIPPVRPREIGEQQDDERPVSGRLSKISERQELSYRGRWKPQAQKIHDTVDRYAADREGGPVLRQGGVDRSRHLFAKELTLTPEEMKILKSRHEILLIHASDGRLKTTKLGEVDRHPFPRFAPKDAILTHNHPGGRGPSGSDLRAALENTGWTMRVIAKSKEGKSEIFQFKAIKTLADTEIGALTEFYAKACKKNGDTPAARRKALALTLLEYPNTLAYQTRIIP